MISQQRVRALVLSGGGAKGAYEAGLVTSLMRDFGEDFDIVCGTSIGAINASFVAQGKLDELTQVWNGIARRAIVDPVVQVRAVMKIFATATAFGSGSWRARALTFPTFFWILWTTLPQLLPLAKLALLTGGLKPGGAQTMLEQNLDLAHVERVLIASITNLTLRRQDTFYAFPTAYAQLEAPFLSQSSNAYPFEAKHFSETVRASGAIPAAFEPVRLEADNLPFSYVDGGVTNNTPIGQAINAGAEDITIVYVDPENNPAPQESTNIAEILLGCFSMMQQQILDLDYLTALRTNRALTNAPAGGDDTVSPASTNGKWKVKIRKFRPKLPLAPGIIDFDKQDKIDAAFAAGQSDARDPAQRQRFTE